MTATEQKIARARERTRRIVEAGQVTQEVLDALGMRGAPGFAGTGTYNRTGREAGYRRSR